MFKISTLHIVSVKYRVFTVMAVVSLIKIVPFSLYSKHRNKLVLTENTQGIICEYSVHACCSFTPARNATLLLMRTVITRSAAGGIGIALPVTMLSVTPSTLLPSPLLLLLPRRPLAYCLARRLARETFSFHAGALDVRPPLMCLSSARYRSSPSLRLPNTWPCPPSWCAEEACSQPLSLPLFRDGLRPSCG